MNSKGSGFFTVIIFILVVIGSALLAFKLLPEKGAEEKATWINFDSKVTDKELPWSFYPLQVNLLARPGQNQQILYHVENLSDKEISGQAKFEIRPVDKQKYVDVIQCFCFSPQTIGPRGSMDLPIMFRISPDAPPDIKQFEIYLDYYEKVDASAMTLELLGEGKKGTLEVRVKDDREAIEDFKTVKIQITGIGIHKDGLPWRKGWGYFEGMDQSFDLTKLVDGVSAHVTKKEVPAGKYNAAALVMGKVVGVLKNDPNQRERKVLYSNSPAVVEFEVKEGQTASLTFDLGVFDRTDHPTETYRVLIKEMFTGKRQKTDGKGQIKEDVNR